MRDLTVPGNNDHNVYIQAADTSVLVHNCVTLAPSQVRFSRNSVNDAAGITESIRANGWVGDPIDVVRMPDGGLTTMDNTRVLAAHEAVWVVGHGLDRELIWLIC